MDKHQQRSRQIAAGNDYLRRCGCNVNADGIRGRIVVTPGVLPIIDRVLPMVMAYDNFDEDSDPYGQRDFGAFDGDSEPIYWKIDYYDMSMEYGADPHDTDDFIRVLTIMLASEY